MNHLYKDKTKIIDEMATLEHARWARWQNYLHSFLTWNNDIQAWVLSHEKKDRWQMQVNTPYEMLSEAEKESDRKEVQPYFDLINQHLTAIKEEIRKWADENKFVADNPRGGHVVDYVDLIKFLLIIQREV